MEELVLTGGNMNAGSWLRNPLWGQPWTRLWQEGHGVSWQRMAEHVDRHAEDWARALLG
ncbi:hypothetical protein [Kibdelosporangium aridum]|uniref:hypothetical protein n=1 Tax=Kibdelosporangium aridum TaxID=2030 RepID=UPI000B31A8C8|nr:hypothetical protein [Kibdelosporangium aridum]